MEIVFRQRYPWTLLPYRATVDLAQREEDSMIYREHFRWLRKDVTPISHWLRAADAPVGWIIPSPVDLQLTPVLDTEVEVPEPERKSFCKASGLDFVEDSFFPNDPILAARERAQTNATRKQDSSRFCDAGFDAIWDSMFTPVGLSHFEWHLGWGVEIPSNYYMMIAPLSGQQDIEIPWAMLSAAQLRTFNSNLGFALAMKPKRVAEIRRRQPIARVILMHVDALRAKGVFNGNSEECD